MNMYNHHPCQTIGSIVLTDIETKRRVLGIDTASIYFNAIPLSVVDALIEEGQVMFCAGKNLYFLFS